MANVLTVPNSGIISFDNRAYSNLTVPPLSTSARIIYDGGGGINITSYTTATTALDRFSVDGTQGRLFSVTDALTGKLFSVNNITGLPILEVLDSDTVIAGQFNTNAFVLSGTRLGLGTTPIGTNRLSVSGNTRLDTVDETQTFVTISLSTLNLVLTSASFFVVNLNSSITATNFLNPPAASRAYSFVLQLCATGVARSVVWPTTVRWPGGSAPVLTQTLTSVDNFTFLTYDGGNAYFGFPSGLDFRR
jgi:hypothetical protein